MEPVWTTPAGNVVRLDVRDDTNDWNICQSIIAEDEYKIPTGLSGVAVDIGAHIGACTVRLLADNPDLHVVAVEPVPENAALLRQNTAKYGERVTIIEGAGGNGPQTVRYNWRGNEIADVHRFIANQYMPAGTDHDEITVPGITLSEIVERVGPISFLKIDCEGCEDTFLNDPAIEQVAQVSGEYHTGAAVELRFDKPERTAPPKTKASTNGAKPRKRATRKRSSK